MQSKRNEELKKRFVEWSSSSTSHGYPNIFRTDKWGIRIMWLFFLLVSTGFCFYMVTRSIMDFLGYEVVTKIRVFNEVPIEFPTITICNINPFTTSASLELFNQTFNNVKGSYSNDSDEVEDVFDRFLLAAKNPSYGDENRKALSPKLNDMVIDCEFSKNNCNLSEFEWFYMVDYANCFRFNAGLGENQKSIPIKKSYRGGQLFGLKMMLLVDKTETPLGIRPMSGIKIFIDNSSFYPNYLANGVDLKTGTHTNIVLKKVFNERVPEPYSECKKEITSEAYNNMRKMGKNYRQSDCELFCMQKMIINKCNCYYLYYDPIDRTTPPCTNNSQNECILSYLSLIDSDKVEMGCIKECPPECSKVTYEYLTSSSDFPSQKIYEYLKTEEIVINNLASDQATDSFEEIRKRVTSFSIYFNELSYTKIEETRKTSVPDLISGVGGIIYFPLLKT
jgi:hypothetical protein